MIIKDAKLPYPYRMEPQGILGTFEVRRVEVKVFRERAICPKCDIEMKMESSHLTHPPQYEYKCPRCRMHSVSDLVYPRIIHREVTE